MRRAVWVLVLLNLAALAAAYAVVQRTPEGAAGAVTLWRLAPAQVTRVESRDAERVVTIQPEHLPGGQDGAAGRRILWISARATDAETPGVAFQGNQIAQRLLDNLATLKARRRLEPLADEAAATGQLKDFGLDAPTQTLELAREEGEPLRIQVGRATYGGSQRYVRRDGDRAVYLVANPILARFAAPQRLLDRTVLPRERRAAARLRLTWQGQTRDLWRGEDAKEETWSASAGGEPLPAAKAVVDALAGLAVAEYVAPARVGAGDTPRLTVEFFNSADGAAAPEHWVRLYGAGREPVLISSYTRNPVLPVNAAVEKLLKHAAAMFAAQ